MSARICIPVCAKTLDQLIAATRSAVQIGDLVELRLDCLDANELTKLSWQDLDHKNDFILTLRDPKQGGCRDVTRAERINFWRERLPRTAATWCDIELDLALELEHRGVLTDWSNIVCSHHEFDGVPDNLDQVYSDIAQTPAGIIKIAVQATDVTDCLPVFALLQRASSEGRNLIAIAMGNAGIATRVLGPSRGAFLTYGAAEVGLGTAPGQLTATALRSIYRIDQIDRTTDIFGLIGFPATHSVSPHMHNAAFAELGLNAVYLPLEVKDVSDFFKRMVHPKTREIDWNARGVSVTAPHKTVVMGCLDSIDENAKSIGSVNTVVVRDVRLFGFNTDAEGFLAPLQRKVGSLRDSTAAVIGAGGAANAVVWALCREGSKVTVFARNENKAADLANRFGATNAPLPASFGNYDIVVNSTPLGSVGPEADKTPATAEQLCGARLVYDLVYNPIETVLLNEARRAGCEILGGLEMLVAQAALQFKLWTGREAPIDLMHTAAFDALR